MCVLLVGNPALMDGWGCCRCKTYNGLWRDTCKYCNEPHHPLATNDTPDVLDARAEKETDGEPS